MNDTIHTPSALETIHAEYVIHKMGFIWGAHGCAAGVHIATNKKTGHSKGFIVPAGAIDEILVNSSVSGVALKKYTRNDFCEISKITCKSTEEIKKYLGL